MDCMCTDILHIHSASIPQAPRVLQGPGCFADGRYTVCANTTQLCARSAEHIQKFIRETHKRPLRHCPPGRCSGISLLLLPGNCQPSHRHSVRSLWPAKGPPLLYGRQHPVGCSVGSSHRLPDVHCFEDCWRPERGQCAVGLGHCDGY